MKFLSFKKPGYDEFPCVHAHDGGQELMDEN
jgi:hypothetical protein